jgi:soluble cytochrome b562
MKSLTVIIAALVVTLILNGPIQSYADPQLDTLVNIATQAKNNLNISISQISNVPVEITSLYQQGSRETDALIKATTVQDIGSAKQHFLSAMNFFKETNDKINSLNATETNEQQRGDIAKLQSEITRLTKIAGTLRTVAITNHADFNFTPFDTSIQQAKQALDAGKINEASKSIDTANQLIVDAHHDLSEIAQERASDRAKDFTEKQIERFDKINDLNTTQNYSSSISNTTISTMNATQTLPENPGEMVAKLRKLVAEGNVDEALKIIKSLDKYQNKAVQNNENVTQQSQTSINIQNNTNSNSTLPPVIQSNTSSTNLPNVTTSNPAGINSSNDIQNQTNENYKTSNNSSSNNNSDKIEKNKKIDHIEHHGIPLNIDAQNKTNLDSNPVSSNPSNFTSTSDVKTNQSSSNDNQTDEDKNINKTISQITPHENVDSQQPHKTHERNSNPEQKERPAHKQNNH